MNVLTNRFPMFYQCGVSVICCLLGVFVCVYIVLPLNRGFREQGNEAQKKVDCFVARSNTSLRDTKQSVFYLDHDFKS